MLSLSGKMRLAHYQRAHSEVNFWLANDLDLVLAPFDASVGSEDEMGSEDDLFFYLHKYGEARCWRWI